MTVDWIRQGLKDTRKTRSGLRKRSAARPRPSPICSTALAACAPRRSRSPPNISASSRRVWSAAAGPRHPSGRVPLVGYVGAGAIAHFYADGQGPFDEVEAPDAASPSTVAVQIRGHSLGALFDNWLVFYDDVRESAGRALVGRMCVCGLSDGRVLVKALKRGQVAGIWTLLSNTEPPIYDVALDWAALVREMRPR